MNMNFDTIVDAVGKDEVSLQNNFMHTKEVFGINWEIFTEKLSYPISFSKQNVSGYSKALRAIVSQNEQEGYQILKI